MSKERQPINFRLVLSSHDIKQNARSQIGFVAGMQPRQVRPAEIGSFYERTGAASLWRFLEDHSSRPLATREVGEKAQSLRQYAETLLDKETSYRSYGIHAPSYLAGLKAYREFHPQEEHTSLLVGALTPSTVTEFAVITDHVFPHARLHLLDIEGVETKQACEASGVSFHQGSGLRMPFPDASFNTVQADFLLENLRTDDDAHHTNGLKRQRFFQEVYHVLKPGGLMLLIDHSYPKDIAEFLHSDLITSLLNGDLNNFDLLKKAYANILGEEMKRTGFEEIAIFPAVIFRSRKELEKDILLGNAWDIPGQALTLSSETLLIQAVK